MLLRLANTSEGTILYGGIVASSGYPLSSLLTHSMSSFLSILYSKIFVFKRASVRLPLSCPKISIMSSISIIAFPPSVSQSPLNRALRHFEQFRDMYRTFPLLSQHAGIGDLLSGQ